MNEKQIGSVKSVTLADVEAAEARSGITSPSAQSGGVPTTKTPPDPKEARKIEKDLKKIEKEADKQSKTKNGVPTTKVLPR
jgi:hypothetical protein